MNHHKDWKKKKCVSWKMKSVSGHLKLRIVGPPFRGFWYEFADFISNIFSTEKEKGKTIIRMWENDSGITGPSRFTKKLVIPVVEPPFLPTNVLLSHVRAKDDVEARKGKYAVRYSLLSLFERSSLCWNDCLCGCSKRHRWPTPSDKFARFSWGLTFLRDRQC